VKIAFDEQIFLRQQFGGISRYVCSLAGGLRDLPDVDARIFAPVHINSHLAGARSGVSAGRLAPWRAVLGKGRFLRGLQSLSASMARREMKQYYPGIVHETYFAGDRQPVGNAARVLTVYDMIHERFASEFGPGDQISRWKKASVQRADRVICISESTKADLVERFDVAEEKAVVVYLGFDDLAAQAPEFAPGQAPAPYLLYVGLRGGYKNFTGFLRAYAASPWLRDNFRVVCFGGGPPSAGEKQLGHELGLQPGQVEYESGGDKALAGFYRDAGAFVYPSIYEGFGIPPLEAMSMGCPVICSNTSSIPEVAGDAAAYFDPADIDSIRHALESTMTSPDLQRLLVARGRRRVEAFSWTECAARTRDVYRQVT
jgi:glycosyltransferase involved in cell wall biosynthesis